MHYIFRMAAYQDSTSMSTSRLTLLLVGHRFVHFRAVCNSMCAGNTNIAVLLYLTNIAALL